MVYMERLFEPRSIGEVARWINSDRSGGRSCGYCPDRGYVPVVALIEYLETLPETSLAT
jgi:hypothetical protein